MSEPAFTSSQHQTIVLRGYDAHARRPHQLTFTGRLIAEASSRAARHATPLVHDEDSFAPPGVRCSACRWFEVRIWAVEPERSKMRTDSSSMSAAPPQPPEPSRPDSSVPERRAANSTRAPLEDDGGPSSPPSTAAGADSGPPDAGWVVETVGRTTVPDETDRRQFRHVTEPRGVVAALVQTRARLDVGGRRIEDADEDVFIPATSRRALDLAADADERLTDAIDRLLVFD